MAVHLKALDQCIQKQKCIWCQAVHLSNHTMSGLAELIYKIL